MAEINEICLKDIENNILSQINKINLPPGKNQVVINNIAVQNTRDMNPVLYDAILEEINRIGGLKAFVNQIYEYTVNHCGNVNQASHALNIDNKAMYARMKQIRKGKNNEKTDSNNGNDVVGSPGNGGG